MAMHVSVKRLQIDKANTIIVAAVGVAAFALTFSLVAARSLLAKQSYQNKVVEAREKARNQLDTNIAAVDELKVKYNEFVDRQENIIKGSKDGTGQQDGDNARIVLDALPSKYDFPGLASSLEKILVDRNYTITGIGGVDEEASRNGATTTTGTTGSAPPVIPASGTAVIAQPSVTVGTAVEMPFEVSAQGDYQNMIDLLSVFQSSIRPVKLRMVTMTATEGTNVELTINGSSFYQPERTLNVKEEVVQ